MMKNLFAWIICFFLSIATIAQEKVEIANITIKGNKITKEVLS